MRRVSFLKMLCLQNETPILKNFRLRRNLNSEVPVPESSPHDRTRIPEKKKRAEILNTKSMRRCLMHTAFGNGGATSSAATQSRHWPPARAAGTPVRQLASGPAALGNSP